MGKSTQILEEDKRKIAGFINHYVKKNGYNVVLSNKELNELLRINGVDKKSEFFQESDYCYNRTNKGMIKNYENELHLFEYVKRGYYRLLGENYKYTGNVMHKRLGKGEYVAGRWKEGVLVEWNPRIDDH